MDVIGIISGEPWVERGGEKATSGKGEGVGVRELRSWQGPRGVLDHREQSNFRGAMACIDPRQGWRGLQVSYCLLAENLGSRCHKVTLPATWVVRAAGRTCSWRIILG